MSSTIAVFATPETFEHLLAITPDRDPCTKTFGLTHRGVGMVEQHDVTLSPDTIPIVSFEPHRIAGVTEAGRGLFVVPTTSFATDHFLFAADIRYGAAGVEILSLHPGQVALDVVTRRIELDGRRFAIADHLLPRMPDCLAVKAHLRRYVETIVNPGLDDPILFTAPEHRPTRYRDPRMNDDVFVDILAAIGIADEDPFHTHFFIGVEASSTVHGGNLTTRGLSIEGRALVERLVERVDPQGSTPSIGRGSGACASDWMETTSTFTVVMDRIHVSALERAAAVELLARHADILS